MRPHKWIKFGEPVKTVKTEEETTIFLYRCSGCQTEVISDRSRLKYVSIISSILEDCDEMIVSQLMER